MNKDDKKTRGVKMNEWEEELLLTLMREYFRGCVIGMDDGAMGKCFVNVMTDYQEHFNDFLKKISAKEAERAEKRKKEKAEQRSCLAQTYQEQFGDF